MVVLKHSKRKQVVTWKRTPIRQSADFSAKILKVRREWDNMFKVLKEKNL